MPHEPWVVPDELVPLLHRQDDVLSTAQQRAAGIGAVAVRTLVRRAEWTPLLQGSHLVRPREGLALTRSWARSASLVLPRATVGLRSAALLHGVEGVPPVDGVEVVVAAGAEKGRRRGLHPHVWPLVDDEVCTWAGVRVTTPVRTLADLVLQVDRLTALAVMDSALRRGVVDADGLLAARSLAAGRPGCRAVEELWALADGRAESPLESRVRLRAVDAGLVPDELQWRVRGSGDRVVARADLAFLERRRPGRGPLLVEADGVEPHGTPAAVYADRHRANAVAATGCDVLRFTWRDTLSPHLVPTVIAAAL